MSRGRRSWSTGAIRPGDIGRAQGPSLLELGRVFVSARGIVELMGELVSAGGAEIERRHGGQALDLLYEVQAALMAAMESDLSYVVLWEQFLLTPQEVELAVVSVVQTLMAADPVLAEWLDAALVRYREAAGS